ncbi:hypothetical protein [Marivita hallyeonensis]|uniref:Uncharacterized protein n=1 Tax=Marivita hallyeonensis TaxID=996342 RepID=A0A1M5NJH5_9RHOB|nr:hypothetical protein [Marivita hallyeonensis]SHG89359.1 hypothetical protein SAMN05443551_0941 [Marivita hallyeonensis]
MGPVRRGVILSLLPTAAIADTCAEQRPSWDGTPVSMAQEAMFLATTPAALVLAFGTVLALRFRSSWGGLVVVLGWTAFVTFITMLAPESRKAAFAEGCVGNPALFIAIIAAICVGTIFYTAPPRERR